MSQSIEQYIHNSWTVLRRTLRDLPRAAYDPKYELEDGSSLVYVPPGEDLAEVTSRLSQALSTQEIQTLSLRALTPEALAAPSSIAHHGLLYLPHPYVVPGGRFNEMYGWDSYFINLGLLKAGLPEEAWQMTENHLYQVEHYGKILNANRTYYLTRSQPPFLAPMVWECYQATQDRGRLEASLDGLLKTYQLWVGPNHLTPETGLSRYFDWGDGPAPEVLSSECDEYGLSHYDRIKEEFKSMAGWSSEKQQRELGYPLELYYDRKNDALSDLFYKGDRTMRESGFDPSDRFGRFNLDVIHYNPVDLNSLLYLYECQMARIVGELEMIEQVATWRARAERRARLMQELFWDQEQQLFFDYNFRTGERRHYPFATAFFPLYTGWATQKQSELLSQRLEEFLHPGGVVTSFHRSGNQWDYPYGWAPLQLVAALGLQRYGYLEQARRVASAFTGLVEQEFERTGTVLEKYDVVNGTSSVSEGIEFGYSSNEVGFGWTNGVYLVLKEMCQVLSSPSP